MLERNLNTISVHSIVANPETTHYTPEFFSCKSVGNTGKGVKICIIDSGSPNHKAISNCAGEINFTTNENIQDEIGHATLMAGIIGGNSQSFSGIAPKAELLFAKIADTRIRIDACVAAILWGIIRGVDIIVIPLTTTINSPALYDAIKKAHTEGVVVISPAGNHTIAEYPALYDEVLGVGAEITKNKLAAYSANGKVNIIGDKILSTYNDQKYALVTGTSVATAVGAGICARIIEEFRSKKQKYTVQTVIDKMKTVCG